MQWAAHAKALWRGDGTLSRNSRQGLVAGGEHAGGGQVLTSSPHCNPPVSVHGASISRVVNRKPCTGQGRGWQRGQGQGCSSRTLRALRERRFQNLHSWCHRQQNSHRDQAQVCCQSSGPAAQAEMTHRVVDGHHMAST